MKLFLKFGLIQAIVLIKILLMDHHLNAIAIAYLRQLLGNFFFGKKVQNDVNTGKRHFSDINNIAAAENLCLTSFDTIR